MSKILIFFAGLFVGVLVASLGEAAREKKPPQLAPLIKKQDQRVETLCVTHTTPKGGPDRTEEIAHRLGRGLLNRGLIKIDRKEGMEWTFVTGTVRVVVPEKEAEQ